MLALTIRSLILVLGAAFALCAGTVTLEDTIPTGNLFLQPPVLTGAAPLFGGGGVVLADGFTAPVTAALDQISVVVAYQDFPSLGITGRSPMLLTLLTDNGDSPGAAIESWTVPVDPSDTMLTIVTVSSTTNPVLESGQQYWLSEVPVDSTTTGIGWGLASAGYPGIQLPIAENDTGMNSGWDPTSMNLANEFSVTGATVPEPAHLWHRLSGAPRHWHLCPARPQTKTTGFRCAALLRDSAGTASCSARSDRSRRRRRISASLRRRRNTSASGARRRASLFRPSRCRRACAGRGASPWSRR